MSKVITVSKGLFVSSEKTSVSNLSSQAPLLVPALVRIVHSSTQMARVCAELVSSSTMIWISKAQHLTVNWTASLRSADASSSSDLFALYSLVLLACFTFSFLDVCVCVLGKQTVCHRTNTSGSIQRVCVTITLLL